MSSRFLCCLPLSSPVVLHLDLCFAVKGAAVLGILKSIYLCSSVTQLSAGLLLLFL